MNIVGHRFFWWEGISFENPDGGLKNFPVWVLPLNEVLDGGSIYKNFFFFFSFKPIFFMTKYFGFLGQCFGSWITTNTILISINQLAFISYIVVYTAFPRVDQLFLSGASKPQFSIRPSFKCLIFSLIKLLMSSDHLNFGRPTALLPSFGFHSVIFLVHPPW